MLNQLIERYPQLELCREDIANAEQAFIRCFEKGGKLLICGNGGSCADSDHIVGELMKGFLKRRPLSEGQKEEMKMNNPLLDDGLLEKLQGALPAIALPAIPALNSAFCNDVDPDLVYAQPLMGLGKPGDLLLAISTSGNAENVLCAAKVAKGLGLTVVALTGEGGGKLVNSANLAVCVPEKETYKVQELHLPIYHYLCAAAEDYFFWK